MAYFVKFLEPLENPIHDISIGKGAELQLNLASRPMILAVRKQYLDHPHSMLISGLGVQFLFSFDGLKERDKSFLRP